MTNALKPLTGKTALVTGGARSIGAAIVKRLAADGASVAFTYSVSSEQAREVVDFVEADGGRALAIKADSGVPEQVRAAVAQTVETFGAIDILVNNAGVSVLGAINDIAFVDYERALSVNVTGAFVATQEAARQMKSGGRIINIGSSMARYAGFGGASVYTLTKGALLGFMRSLARDLGPRGITVNTVSPGPTDTDANPEGSPIAKMLSASIAVGRYGQPAEIASVVAYLARAEAGFINGADIAVDGGFTA